MSKKTTKPNKTNKRSKNNKFKISRKMIILPNGKKITMNISRWIMSLTIFIILILYLFTMPTRIVKMHIKSFDNKDDIVAYCEKKNYNCVYTIESDYDIEGFNVSRVSFLADDFFVNDNAKEEQEKSKKNVYITIQQEQTIDLPE